jgi:hypothetical protein
VLAFTSVYFSESRLFNGLRSIQIRKSRLVSGFMQNVSAGFLFSSLSIVSLSALSQAVANRQALDQVNRKYVTKVSDFCKHLFGSYSAGCRPGEFEVRAGLPLILTFSPYTGRRDEGGPLRQILEARRPGSGPGSGSSRLDPAMTAGLRGIAAKTGQPATLYRCRLRPPAGSQAMRSSPSTRTPEPQI